MDLNDLHFLLTPEGERMLRQLAETPITPQNHLSLVTNLRQRVSPGKAQALLELALLRQLASVKFSRADQMFFTRSALEQATAEVVSRYRARRFANLGAVQVADLGCGIGGDALALAAHAEVTGVDWDPLRLAMAQENVRIYGHGESFHPLQADLLELTPLPVQAAFFDPSRRDDRGRRFFSLNQYQPPVKVIDRWRGGVPHVAVKIGPGVDYAELPEGAELEFISVKGEVREGVLWFGDLQSGVKRRATLLPGENTLTTAEARPEAIELSPPKAYLYEPDKAVIRAHLVEVLAQKLEANKIDPDIAYLTADSIRTTPFARAFALEAHFPFQLKRLRHYLREHRIGRVTLKKRGSPLDLEKLQHQLRLRGHEHRTVILSQVSGTATVLIGQALDGGGEVPHTGLSESNRG
jgi:SAM-dependent methyltransferase